MIKNDRESKRSVRGYERRREAGINVDERAAES